MTTGSSCQLLLILLEAYCQHLFQNNIGLVSRRRPILGRAISITPSCGQTKRTSPAKFSTENHSPPLAMSFTLHRPLQRKLGFYGDVTGTSAGVIEVWVMQADTLSDFICCRQLTRLISADPTHPSHNLGLQNAIIIRLLYCLLRANVDLDRKRCSK